MFRVKQFLKIASLIVCVIVMGIALGVGGYYLYQSVGNSKGDKININEVVEGKGISRFEWIQMLCDNYSVKEYDQSVSYYSDVDENSEFFSCIQAAVEYGILDPGGEFNGDAVVTGKYAAVTVCKAIGESTFVIYTGDEGKWTNDKYLDEAVQLGIIDAEKVDCTLSRDECEDIIGTAVYVENTELWIDDFVDIQYKKGTYEIEEDQIEYISEECNEIRLSAGKYKKGDSLVFKNQDGFVVAKTIISVTDTSYLLEDADLDKVLEKYYVSDIKEITLEDICSTGEWEVTHDSSSDVSCLTEEDFNIVDIGLGEKSGETDLYDNDNAFIIKLKTDKNCLCIELKGNNGYTASRTINDYKINKPVAATVEIKNLKVKYKYDYFGLYNQIIVDCDATVESGMEIEQDLISIPIWQPVPNISLGEDTVNVSMGLFLTITAKGEIYFSVDMPVSVGVENHGSIINPVIQMHEFNNPVFSTSGEVFAGLKFEVKVNVLGEDGIGAGAELDVGAKVNGSRIVRTPNEQNHLVACSDISVTAPYIKIEGNITIFDEHTLSYEEGLKIPGSLHVELYTTDNPRVAVVPQCTYQEPPKVDIDLTKLKNAMKKCDIDHAGLTAMRDNNIFLVWVTATGDTYWSVLRYDTNQGYVIRAAADGYIYISDSQGTIYLMDESISPDVEQAWLNSFYGLLTALDNIHLHEKLLSCIEIDISENDLTLEQIEDNKILAEYAADDGDTYSYILNTDDYHLSQCTVEQANGISFMANMDTFVVFPDEYHALASDDLLLSMIDCFDYLSEVFK